jgi:hypothetical protein
MFSTNFCSLHLLQNNLFILMFFTCFFLTISSLATYVYFAFYNFHFALSFLLFTFLQIRNTNNKRNKNFSVHKIASFYFYSTICSPSLSPLPFKRKKYIFYAFLKSFIFFLFILSSSLKSFFPFRRFLSSSLPYFFYFYDSWSGSDEVISRTQRARKRRHAEIAESKETKQQERKRRG